MVSISLWYNIHPTTHFRHSHGLVSARHAAVEYRIIREALRIHQCVVDQLHL